MPTSVGFYPLEKHHPLVDDAQFFTPDAKAQEPISYTSWDWIQHALAALYGTRVMP